MLPGLMSSRLGADSLLLAMKERANSYINTPRLQMLVNWAENAINEPEKISMASAKRAAAIYIIINLGLERALGLKSYISLGSRNNITVAEFEFPFGLGHHRHDLFLVRDIARNLAQALKLDLNYATDPPFSLVFTNIFMVRTDIFLSVDFQELARLLEQLNQNKPNKESSSEEEEKSFFESIHRLWFSALGLDHDVANLSKQEVQDLADYFYICELMVRCKEGATRVSPDVWEGIESSILTLPDND